MKKTLPVLITCLLFITAEGDGENASMTTFNTSQKNSANIVGQQLLLNLLKY